MHIPFADPPVASTIPTPPNGCSTSHTPHTCYEVSPSAACAQLVPPGHAPHTHQMPQSPPHPASPWQTHVPHTLHTAHPWPTAPHPSASFYISDKPPLSTRDSPQDSTPLPDPPPATQTSAANALHSHPRCSQDNYFLHAQPSKHSHRHMDSLASIVSPDHSTHYSDPDSADTWPGPRVSADYAPSCASCYPTWTFGHACLLTRHTVRRLHSRLNLVALLAVLHPSAVIAGSRGAVASNSISPSILPPPNDAPLGCSRATVLVFSQNLAPYA
jgi:hypothetical protein